MRKLILVSAMVLGAVTCQCRHTQAAGWWFEVGLPAGSYNTGDGKTNSNMEWSPMLGPYNTYHDCDCWDVYMMKRFPVSAITGCMGFFAGGADQFTCTGYDYSLSRMLHPGDKPVFIGK